MDVHTTHASPQVIFLVVNHWNGCIQFLVPSILNFPAMSWPVKSGALFEGVFAQYTWSLYRSLSQAISCGYGSPGDAVFTFAEAWNLNVAFCINTFCWIIIVGLTVSLVVDMDGLDKEYRCGPGSGVRGRRCTRGVLRVLCGT